MQVYFYLMCYKTEALVASHLSPEEFGPYMAVGTKKLTLGNVVYFQIDPGKAGFGFDFEAGRALCQPHSDNSPKHSKYLGVYRVLERLPLAALMQLYLTTQDGRVLALSQAQYPHELEKEGEHLYAQLCPLTTRVVAKSGPKAFAELMTNPQALINVPRIVFAEQKLKRGDFGGLASNLPYRDPVHIVDCLDELLRSNKPTKSVDRNPRLQAFFRTITNGIFVGDQTGILYYPFPSEAELEDKYQFWWRSAAAG